MNVEYKRPSIDTKFEVFDSYSFLKVDYDKYVSDVQVSLGCISDEAAAFLEGYKLPDGINGSARFIFRGYNAKTRGLLWFKKVGVVGFPSISIDTDLGSSHISLHPEYIHGLYPNGHIEIGVSGHGLVDRLAEKILQECEHRFNGKVSLYKEYTTIQEFKPNHPGCLSKRICVPLNL